MDLYRNEKINFSYYELFQQEPAVYIPVLLISLLITLIGYSLFPLLFAFIRKKVITKTKYNIFCYGINILVNLFFVIVNGKSSGSPYFLWTFVFSIVGTHILKKRCVLEGYQHLKSSFRYDQKEHSTPNSNINEETTKDKQDSCEGQSIDVKHSKQSDNMQAETSNFKKFTVCIYDAVNGNIRKEERTIDTNKFPPEKYAEDGMYYAIEKMKNDKNVRFYCLKASWQRQVNHQTPEKNTIRFCSKCGYELLGSGNFCSYCGERNSEECESISKSKNLQRKGKSKEKKHISQNNNGSKKLSPKKTVIDIINVFLFALPAILSVIAVEELYIYDYDDIYASIFIIGSATFILKLINVLKSKETVVMTIITACCLILMLSLALVCNDEEITILICLLVVYLIICEFCKIIKWLIDKYHATQSYRIKCYRRIDVLNECLRKGIITEDEYEKSRKKIMGTIS